MQPTEYYRSDGDSQIVILADLGDGLSAVLKYSERHNVSSVGVMLDSTIAKYYTLVNEEPWFWPECLTVITDTWYL